MSAGRSSCNPASTPIARLPDNGLSRLAAWCYDHRRQVLASWVLAVMAVIGLAQWSGSRRAIPGLAVEAGGEPDPLPVYPQPAAAEAAE